MRVAFILSFVANWLVAFAGLVLLPDQAAVHFTLGGVPDRWGSNLAHTALVLGLNTLLFLVLYFLPGLLSKLPARWISLPNRDYWLQPAKRQQAERTLRRLFWQMGAALFLLLSFAGVLTIRANLSDPVRLDETVFLIGIGVFFVFTAWWLIAVFRAFRKPSP